ncbi:MAG: alpha-amylase family glycosyl hydrolase, partial [Candidatus Sericytochromatia bacterium]
MTRRRPVLAALLAAAMALAAPTPSATAAPSAVAQAWQNEVIYLIMTDRFYNGDRTNDFKVRPNDPHGFHGGDLEGVIRKLDYIKDLGATAIWLTPIVDNQDNAFLDQYWGYHGYWIQDFEKVEEHLGTEATYKRLVDEAHKRGLKVIMDVVANHVGYDAPVTKDESFKDWFHHNGSISNWEDPYENENFDLAGLPDFNTENKEVLEFHEEVWGDWIKRTGLDGFRIDTVRHVPRPFWIRFNETMRKTGGDKFLLLGEVSYHTPEALAPYITEAKFDSLFDFPLSFALVDVFAKGQSMRLLDQRLKEDGRYPDAKMLTTFLDNHDYPRFLTVAGGD